MTLSNFGSVLGFALEVETQNSVFLTDAAAMPACESNKAAFESLAQNSHKRVKEIERIRRENVTEMILESLEGLTKTPFLCDPGAIEDMARDEIVATALDLLNRSIHYYEEAGSKLKRLTEVARALKGLVKKTRRDAGQLEALNG